MLTKGTFGYIITDKKGKTANGYANHIVILSNNRLGRGGYSAFMEKIINKMIISKIANSNFLF